MNIKDTPEYRQGYWDGVKGKQVPWAHLMDGLYLAGHAADTAFMRPKPRKSAWWPF